MESRSVTAQEVAVQEGAWTTVLSYQLGEAEAAEISAVGVQAPPGAWPYLSLRLMADGVPIWSRSKVPVGPPAAPSELELEVGAGTLIALEACNDTGVYPYNSYIYVSAALELLVKPSGKEEQGFGRFWPDVEGDY